MKKDDPMYDYFLENIQGKYKSKEITPKTQLDHLVDQMAFVHDRLDLLESCLKKIVEKLEKR